MVGNTPEQPEQLEQPEQNGVSNLLILSDGSLFQFDIPGVA
jgi:hypothetical protein